MGKFTMKILCSGNPSDMTVANGISKIFDNAEFASRTTGYDLRFWDKGSKSHFQNNISNYDVFINASFICGWGQHQLLETTFYEWERLGIHGHIINIGSTSEWEGVNSEFGTYTVQKQALQSRSLQLNNVSGIKTTHMVIGGINDGKKEHRNWMPPADIAKTIKWILNNCNNIPLIAMV